jgi:hypothetical protein
MCNIGGVASVGVEILTSDEGEKVPLRNAFLRKVLASSFFLLLKKKKKKKYNILRKRTRTEKEQKKRTSKTFSLQV